MPFPFLIPSLMRKKKTTPEELKIDTTRRPSDILAEYSRKSTAEKLPGVTEASRKGKKKKSGYTYISPITNDYVEKKQYEKEKKLVLKGEAQTAGQQALSALGAKVGEVDPDIVAQANAGQLDRSGAFDTAFSEALPSAATGAAAGFGAGLLGGPAAPVTAPTAALLGGAAGFTSAVWSGYIRELESQRREVAQARITDLNDIKSNLNTIIAAQNANPNDMINNVAAFNHQYSLAVQSYESLKLRTQANAAEFSSEKNIADLEDFEIFFSDYGEGQLLKEAMSGAVVSPNRAALNLNEEDLERIRKVAERR